MTPSTRISAVIVLLAGLALPAWGQHYQLYTPQPVPAGQKPSAQDGVLVQEIEIQKGDTLYGLSRKYSGKGMYYPQILLFNSISNPNLIYTGKTLKVPVSHGEAGKPEHTDAKQSDTAPKAKAVSTKKASAKAPASAHRPAATAPASTASTELSLSDLKTSASGKGVASRHKKKSATRAKTIATQELQTAPATSASASGATASPQASAPDTSTGQKLFEAAVKAYRKDDCKTALELLDRYLADNSGSPLAADATLYKAECYLKLSAQ